MPATVILIMSHLHFSRPPTLSPSMTCSTILINKHRQTSSGFSIRVCQIRAQTDGSSSQFVKRIEQAWSISKQPRPVPCSSCDTNGYVECKWCSGTGFFILGDNMLCEVPSRNTACVICAGQGSVRCSNCKGTGFRAKWLGQPIVTAESEPA